ncbi:hypothetical protein OJF2_40880 [Aquisphaera giovannonii]|uniref:Xylosidase/arabinosidase n=1 Tax=Aquisphaera giovannonii TaxID=406548 RepID=A0A5B9W4H7_9BACT|nr:glycoside hydrolase family 71/99-like protein [Aquisphaera giovannonii]QEH35536.1 hypothetical protein OJF2_40880 [Aquisphaera giovannonii]
MMRRLRRSFTVLLGWGIAFPVLAAPAMAQRTDPSPPYRHVDASTIDGKVLCGYQAWFRCPGDPDDRGWSHWSRDGRRIEPGTLSVEMWPDMAAYGEDERYQAPGFTLPDGSPATLFSSANPKTILRHFRWMAEHEIDGAFAQHFLVGLPGGPLAELHPARRRVLDRVAEAAEATGRAWAIAYDIAGMPHNKIYDALTSDWKRAVDSGLVAGTSYLHQDGKPVVQVWGFYRKSPSNAMTPELAHRIVDFFKAQAGGKYAAYLIGGGDWDWRRDEEQRKVVYRFDAYSPWNVGNWRRDAKGDSHASTGWWDEDRRDCEGHGVLWLPVVYPGFGWDNLMRKPAGTTTIPRRGGAFYWEQFRDLRRLGVRSAVVAMFDEVDEGTAIFKVTSSPPTQAHFLTFEGLPSDWYLRLTREGARLLRGDRPDSEAIPITP